MTQLVLTLPPETAARIAKEAAERGLTVEAVAAEAVEAWAAYDDLDWEEDDRRFDDPEGRVSLDEAFSELRERVATARLPRNT